MRACVGLCDCSRSEEAGGACAWPPKRVQPRASCMCVRDDRVHRMHAARPARGLQQAKWVGTTSVSHRRFFAGAGL